MDADQNDPRDMPRLLEPGWVPAPSRARRFWEYLHRWRVSLFHQCIREARGDTQPADLARLVDHLLGTRLLLCYVEQWTKFGPPDLQGLYIAASQSASSGFWAQIQASFSCPILRSVFDPTWVPVDSVDLPVPAAIFASGWEKRIANALWLLSRDRPLPLSFFGDFHQLCVANPLGTDSSRRYERGIHYTPAPIVDYLVNAILGRAFAGRSIDGIKRLRILDPSCGCGAFLIAACRYGLWWLNSHAVCISADCKFGPNSSELASEFAPPGMSLFS